MLTRINQSTYEASFSRGKVEIGDKAKAGFVPALRLSLWDDECHFRVAKSESQVQVVEKGERIEGPDFNLYPIADDEEHPEGGFEFEVVLHQRPKNNIVTFAIEVDNLKFAYQLPLNRDPEVQVPRGGTVTETDVFDSEGFSINHRPEHVVGSYVAYHKTKKHNKYKTGKAFHIYRPKAIDAKGNWVWGELAIDEKAGILTVTLDEGWLDKAAYPVIVDPTFGYTTAGSSYIGGNQAYRGSRAFPVASGEAQSITWYGRYRAISTGSVKCALYLRTGGTNGTLIERAATITGAGGSSDAWHTHDLDSPASINALYSYWMLWWNAETSARLYYDSAEATFSGATESSFANSWPSSISLSGLNVLYSIYCNYDEPIQEFSGTSTTHLGSEALLQMTKSFSGVSITMSESYPPPDMQVIPRTSRSLTEAEKKALLSGHYQPIMRVFVENADGTPRPLHDLRGYDWVDSVDITSDIDTPVDQAVVRLFRDVYQMSLAPLQERSVLNLDGAGLYAPLLDAGRRIWIETPLAPLDTDEELPYLIYLLWAGSETVPEDRELAVGDTVPGESTGGEWLTALLGQEPEQVGDRAERYTVFEGVIDEIDWASPRVEVVARDKGGDMQDTFIEEEREYGDDEGAVLAEDVMRSLLDDNGFAHVDLVLPDGPSGLGIREYTQQHQHLLSAMTDIALQRGWLLRHKYDEEDQEFQLMFYDPKRDKVIPDVIVGPHQYLDVHRLNVNRIPVRNVVRVHFSNENDERHFVTAEDAASIAKYGRRFMELGEASSSQINNEPAATAMAQAILGDLREPKAEQEIEMPYRYDLQLTDLVLWEANGVHYTTDQELAIVAIRHHLSRNRHRTTVGVRGTPAGSYVQWMKRAVREGVVPPVGRLRLRGVDNKNRATVESIRDHELTEAKFNLMFAQATSAGSGDGTATVEHQAVNQDDWNVIKITGGFVDTGTSLIVFHTGPMETLIGFWLGQLSIDGISWTGSYAGPYNEKNQFGVAGGNTAYFGYHVMGPNMMAFFIKRATGTSNTIWLRFKRHAIKNT